ncbi:MAG: helix-turn-helix transcriptional regulator [Spirochaetales bacterium]|nr:helix-turn-helix transcriptional regulator [Spirochaetales bacterium]
MSEFVKLYLLLLGIYGILFADMRIGKQLKKLRSDNDLSLRKLSEALDIPFMTLSSYERDITQPTINNCYVIATYFKVPIEFLILGEDCTREYEDVELKALFSRVDKLPDEKKNVVKRYIRKYVGVLDELAALEGEADS